ncbi:hypothetical protein M8C21_000352, partial [Ambrosia artemisiifolia]
QGLATLRIGGDEVDDKPTSSPHFIRLEAINEGDMMLVLVWLSLKRGWYVGTVTVTRRGVRMQQG